MHDDYMSPVASAAIHCHNCGKCSSSVLLFVATPQSRTREVIKSSGVSSQKKRRNALGGFWSADDLNDILIRSISMPSNITSANVTKVSILTQYFEMNSYLLDVCTSQECLNRKKCV